MESFEDAHVVASLDQVACRGKTCRTAAHDGHAFTGGRGAGDRSDVHVLLFIVGDEALEITDAERLALFAE